MILLHPDPRLYTRCLEVLPEEFGAELSARLEAMVATMLEPNTDGDPQGIGLAAPQVGFMRRCLVMRATQGEEVHRVRVLRMVNPRIGVSAGQETGTEDVPVPSGRACFGGAGTADPGALPTPRHGR